MYFSKHHHFLTLTLTLFLVIINEVHASQTCATTISELRIMLGDQAFPLKWEETSMSDGKPLQVSILEKNENLFLEFTKAREGLWMESTALICKTGTRIEARFTETQIRFGSASTWLLRQALSGGGKLTLVMLDDHKLQISTRGWNGNFIPAQ